MKDEPYIKTEKIMSDEQLKKFHQALRAIYCGEIITPTLSEIENSKSTEFPENLNGFKEKIEFDSLYKTNFDEIKSYE